MSESFDPPAHKRADQVKTDLERTIHTISHDLSEPLRAIQGFSQLLQQRGEELLRTGDLQTFFGWLEQIDEGARRMQRRLDAFRDFGRAGRYELGPGVSLQEVLQDARRALVRLFDEARPTLTVVGETKPVWGHREALVGVVQNLLQNSIKYRRHDTPLEITVQFDNLGDRMVRVAVSDNGQGFDPKYSSSIFELGFRLHSGVASGTGFGLAIVRRTIEQHGGYIWATSQPGVGSTFYFTLHLEAPPPSAPG